MKSKFCVEKYATLYPSSDRRHYIIQKAKAAEGERDRRAISIHAPTSTFPQADGDGRRRPDIARPQTDGWLCGQAGGGHTCIHRELHGTEGRGKGLDGKSHNELGLETTLGPDDPILLGSQSHEEGFKM